MLKKILPALLIVALSCAPLAAETVIHSTGQNIYVPIYSHVYQGIKGKPYNLSALLSIRNVDPYNSIIVDSVRYYGSDGTLVKAHLEEPKVLQPLATMEFHIKERDTAGGSGANYLVHWRADKAVLAPMVEAVMIGTASTQGISFVGKGVVIEEDK